MSEFSVGDRVRVVQANDGLFQPEVRQKMNKEGEIEGTGYGYQGDVRVRFSENTLFMNSDDLELISKGGQNEMENLEAIAVVGDDDLKEKLIDISYGNGWEHILGGDVPVTTTVVFYLENKSVANSNKRSYKEIGLKPSSRFGKISEGKREVLELPQDWEKAKKFVTQDFEESLELAGEEVEVDGKEFSIGCYNGHLDDLQNLVDGLHGLGVNEAEITEQGHSVDIDDLIELREFVEGKQ